MTADLTPGFASPLQAQSCFRAVLAAFATPGTAVTLPVALTPPPGLSPAAAAVLLTLADAQTSVALPDSARNWLTFHTGARLAAPAQADFVAAAARPPLATLRQGSDISPEDGATLILDLPSFAGASYRLSGPGLREPVRVTLPLNGAFLPEWRAQTRSAPRGVDILICVDTAVLALPRSLHIEEA
jgi:alpha-D-ribose 1-methylphosphonate 5-triphosphate synthase subunit PhnH